MARVILVDNEDREIGTEEKTAAHLGDGVLHRAFSAFVRNGRGELLIQKRAAGKMLWPGYWSNTCCSHPEPGEDVRKAGERRLQEELGFSCPLKVIGSFRYHALFRNVGSERELCYIAAGRYDGEVRPNPDEVEDVAWISPEELWRETEKDSDKWTPWFLLEIRKFQKDLFQLP